MQNVGRSLPGRWRNGEVAGTQRAREGEQEVRGRGTGSQEWWPGALTLREERKGAGGEPGEPRASG